MEQLIRNGALHTNPCWYYNRRNWLFQYTMVYKCPFSRRRNVVSDVASQTASGSEFHNIWPPTAKALSVNFRRCGAWISCEFADDRKSQRQGSSLILPPNQISTSVQSHEWPRRPKCTLWTVPFCVIGSQCSTSFIKLVMWSNLKCPQTTWAAVFINTKCLSIISARAAAKYQIC